MVVARDDTERKKLQDDKDGWIAQVSHELRTPLTPIKGFLHTLQRRDDEFAPADRQRIYEVMLREEQRLEDLVNCLLQATTIDQRGLVVVPEVLDWPRGDRRAGRPLPPQRPQSLDHRRRSTGAVGEVVADRNLATGVLANLLSNALKYSPDGSPIEVARVARRRPGRHHGERRGSGHPCWTTGSGSSTSSPGSATTSPARSRAWASGSTSPAARWTRMGGEIWCDERPGGGARFGFTLAHPRRDAASAVADARGRRSAPERRGSSGSR